MNEFEKEWEELLNSASPLNLGAQVYAEMTYLKNLAQHFFNRGLNKKVDYLNPEYSKEEYANRTS